jgi:hypothetical protein
MKVIALAALALLLVAFVVETGFFALATAERVEASSGIKLTGYRRGIVYIWLLIGWPADVLYNWTIGSLTFRELPKELTYSSRVGRLARAGNVKAIAEANFLNAAMPGHIRL